ncbi:MAG: protein kinase [Vicinamibacterales bacterium]
MPENLRQYTLLEQIGSGQLGPLYRAYDTRVGRSVAIRIVDPAIASDPDARFRLFEDARKAAALSHANVAGLVEWGEDDGRLFLAFEYVTGDRLSAVVAGRPLNVRRAIDLGIQLADALAEGHALGLVHGDLRPDTIVVTAKGRPKILDFGFLSWAGGGRVRQSVAELAAVDRATAASIVAYMSPEQALGEMVDHRTDIFSLGALLFEMVTGRPPFSGDTGTATLVRILQAKPPAASELNPLVPPVLDHVISRALSKSIAGRYDSAALLATQLRQVGNEMDALADAAEDSLTAPIEAGRTRRRRRLAAAAAILVALALAAWNWRADIANLVERWSPPAGPAVLAVQPFDSADGEDGQRAYFAEGFAEDLATRLAQVEGLAVVGRRSIRAYEGVRPGVVGQETGAAFVVTGAVGVEGDRARILLRLIDTRTSREAWTGEVQGEAARIIALQAEAASRVAAALRVKAPPGAGRDRAALRVTKPAAYDLYLQGTGAMAADDLARAVPLLEQAVAIDPALAEAQAALAAAIAAETETSGELTPSAAERLTAAAGAAVAADPDLPAAQIAMALAEAGEPEALEYLRCAVQIDRRYSAAYHRLAEEIVAIDPARAIGFLQRSIDLDPRFDESYRDRAWAFILLGNFADAEKDLAAGRALKPSRWWWPALLARMEFEQGRRGKGLEIAAAGNVELRSAATLTACAGALHLEGRTGEALKAVDDFRVSRPGSCVTAALAAALAFDSGRRTEAADNVRRIMDMAEAPGRSDFLYPCAAMAAAAVGDARATASWLRRIAASDTATRRWLRDGHDLSHELALERAAYPWQKVAADPLVIAAAGEIEMARLRLRAQLAKLLEGL